MPRTILHSLCTVGLHRFVPLDRQTGRAVNIDTDTESNDGCMDNKCQNAMWMSKELMQSQTQVDMVTVAHNLNGGKRGKKIKNLKIKNSSSSFFLHISFTFQGRGL